MFDMRSLRRVAFWGGAASLALLLAVLAGFSDQSGRPPEANAAAGGPAKKADAQVAPRPEPDPEVRRLSEVVHMLAGDREQLAVRLATIERNLEDLTGSIKRQGAAGAGQAAAPSTAPAASAPAAPPASVVPAATASEPLALTPKAVAAVRSGDADARDRPVVTPAPVSEAPAELGQSEIAVDVGGATNFEGLRALWNSTRGTNIALLEGLHPVVAVRENSRTSGPELRLLVGPLPNVQVAARLCAAFASARRYCQPVAFEGQRLADAEPAERKPAAAKPSAAQAKAAKQQQQPSPSPRLPRLFQ